MENNNSVKYINNLEENKTEFILSNSIITDIIIFYNYEKKYESISNENHKKKEKENNYVYIICGLMNGFIEIYNIMKDKLELSLSFQAHRDIISKIIQLKQSGFLLTSSYDNSLKIFKLTKNCRKEQLSYIIYLNVIFTRINEVIEMSFNFNIILSVNNYIINFPIKKNNLSDEKNNLEDYNFSKYEHQRKYLNNILEINNEIIAGLDDIENKLLFFKIIYNKVMSDDVTLFKIIELEDND